MATAGFLKGKQAGAKRRRGRMSSGRSQRGQRAFSSPGRVLMPAVGCVAGAAPGSTARTGQPKRRGTEAWKLLREIPFVGPNPSSAADRFDANTASFPVPKRQLWSYSGSPIETHSSAEQRFVQGELQTREGACFGSRA